MGKLGKILSFLRATRRGLSASLVKTNAGSNFNLTPQHCSDAGDDSHPLPGDYVVLVPIEGTGKFVTVAYIDPVNEPVAGEGDKRIYARDSEGVALVHLWLKNDDSAVLSNASGSVTLGADGSILGTNANGSFELEAGGNFAVNGVTIDTDGNITSPASVSAPSIVADGKELAGHTHNITSGSSAPGPTGVNN